MLASAVLGLQLAPGLRTCRRRARAEELDAAIVVLGDVHVAVPVVDNPERIVELAMAGSARTPGVEERAGVREHLDAVVVTVGDRDVARGLVDRDLHRVRELPRARPRRSPGRDERAARRELLDVARRVRGVRLHDVDVVGGLVDRDAVGHGDAAPGPDERTAGRVDLDVEPELAAHVEVAVGTERDVERPGAGRPRLHERAVSRELLHAVVAVVGDVHEPCVVDGDARRVAELGVVAPAELERALRREPLHAAVQIDDVHGAVHVVDGDAVREDELAVARAVRTPHREELRRAVGRGEVRIAGEQYRRQDDAQLGNEPLHWPLLNR